MADSQMQLHKSLWNDARILERNCLKVNRRKQISFPKNEWRFTYVQC